MKENNVVLTSREQNVYDLLIKGSTAKKIADSLNISYNTVLAHQKSLYRKLGVRSINELLSRYAAGIPDSVNGVSEQPISVRPKLKLPPSKILIPAGLIVTALIIILLVFLVSSEDKGTTAVFLRWRIAGDTYGSYMNVTENAEFIQGEYAIINNISGWLSSHHYGYIIAVADPDPSTLEVMKKMSSFSFNVLGDGNTYEIMIQTTDSIAADENHFRKILTFNTGEITRVTIRINELAQSPYFGRQVPLNIENVVGFLFAAYTPGDFNLKIWDIKIH